MQNFTQPIKCDNVKHDLASKIIEHFPPHLQYVEPYFSDGSVLLQKPIGLIEQHFEVVNDIKGGLTNLWPCLTSSDLFEEFRDRLEGRRSRRQTTRSADKRLKQQRIKPSGDRVGLAVAFCIGARQSRQRLIKDFAALSRKPTRNVMNRQMSARLAAIEGLPDIYSRLKRIVIFNDDALKIIKRLDDANTLFYLDPPSLHGTPFKAGNCRLRMTRAEQAALLDCLSGIKGKFILNGYHSKLYVKAKRFGWRYEQMQIDIKGASKETKELKTKFLWMNF